MSALTVKGEITAQSLGDDVSITGDKYFGNRAFQQTKSNYLQNALIIGALAVGVIFLFKKLGV